MDRGAFGGQPHGGGAVVGFANFLIRLFEAEQPRAVLVGWDTLDAPNFRQQLFPPYQGGRDFDPDLVEQLRLLPEFVSAWGFAVYRASHDDYDKSVLPTGYPFGTPQETLDCACGLYLGDPTAWLNPPPPTN